MALTHHDKDRSVTHKLSHHARAEALAAQVFEPSVIEQAELRMACTVQVPLGLVAVAEEIASYMPKPSRSAALVELLRLGYGLFVEKAPADKRKSFLAKVDQRLDDLIEAYSAEQTAAEHGERV